MPSGRFRATGADPTIDIDPDPDPEPDIDIDPSIGDIDIDAIDTTPAGPGLDPGVGEPEPEPQPEPEPEPDAPSAGPGLDPGMGEPDPDPEPSDLEDVVVDDDDELDLGDVGAGDPTVEPVDPEPEHEPEPEPELTAEEELMQQFTERSDEVAFEDLAAAVRDPDAPMGIGVEFTDEFIAEEMGLDPSDVRRVEQVNGEFRPELTPAAQEQRVREDLAGDPRIDPDDIRGFDRTEEGLVPQLSPEAQEQFAISPVTPAGPGLDPGLEVPVTTVPAATPTGPGIDPGHQPAEVTTEIQPDEPAEASLLQRITDPVDEFVLEHTGIDLQDARDRARMRQIEAMEREAAALQPIRAQASQLAGDIADIHGRFVADHESMMVGEAPVAAGRARAPGVGRDVLAGGAALAGALGIAGVHEGLERQRREGELEAVDPEPVSEIDVDVTEGAFGTPEVDIPETVDPVEIPVDATRQTDFLLEELAISDETGFPDPSVVQMSQLGQQRQRRDGLGEALDRMERARRREQARRRRIEERRREPDRRERQRELREQRRRNIQQQRGERQDRMLQRRREELEQPQMPFEDVIGRQTIMDRLQELRDQRVDTDLAQQQRQLFEQDLALRQLPAQRPRQTIAPILDLDQRVAERELQIERPEMAQQHFTQQFSHPMEFSRPFQAATTTGFATPPQTPIGTPTPTTPPPRDRGRITPGFLPDFEIPDGTGVHPRHPDPDFDIMPFFNPFASPGELLGLSSPQAAIRESDTATTQGPTAGLVGGPGGVGGGQAEQRQETDRRPSAGLFGGPGGMP